MNFIYKIEGLLLFFVLRCQIYQNMNQYGYVSMAIIDKKAKR
jgi:hypothetical protein